MMRTHQIYKAPLILSWLIPFLVACLAVPAAFAAPIAEDFTQSAKIRAGDLNTSLNSESIRCGQIANANSSRQRALELWRNRTAVRRLAIKAFTAPWLLTTTVTTVLPMARRQLVPRTRNIAPTLALATINRPLLC